MEYAQSIGIGKPFRSYGATRLRAPIAGDYLLLTTVLALVGFSLVMVYSTTGIVSQEKMGDAFYFLKRQSIAAIVGSLCMLAAMRLPRNFLERAAPVLFLSSVTFLIMTLIPGLGDTAGGASRWVRLGPIRFQPAEFTKLSLILFMASYFARHQNEISTFSAGVMRPLLIVSLVCGLLLMQPDFGSSVVMILVVLCMATAAGLRLRYLALGSIGIITCLGFLVMLSPYRVKRVVSFLSPWADASGKGYQLIQSLIAVGTGQVSGVGLGASQQKLFFLPAAHTDFIFAVICEELGFIGALVVLFAFLIILWRGLLIASKLCEDTFAFCLAVGITMVIVLPALLNVGVVIGLLPTKGMVLPLVGYGGSSLIACLIAVGILLSLRRSDPV